MSRAARRADIAEFRRAASTGVTSFLVDKDDPRLQGERLLSGAIAHWGRNVRARKCFACKARFNDGAAPEVGAFLMVVPDSAPTTCSVSTLCNDCWRTLPDDDLKRHAARVLKPVMPSRQRKTASENP